MNRIGNIIVDEIFVVYLKKVDITSIKVHLIENEEVNAEFETQQNRDDFFNEYESSSNLFRIGDVLIKKENILLLQKLAINSIRIILKSRSVVIADFELPTERNNFFNTFTNKELINV